jgi:hypothetical protein
MSQVQATEANGVSKATQAILAAPDLQAQIDALKAQLSAQVEENKRILATPQVYKGAQYGIVDPSEDYPNTAMKMTLSSGGRAIMGPRRKFLDIIDEVKSGRLEAFLAAHPEVK